MVAVVSIELAERDVRREFMEFTMIWVSKVNVIYRNQFLDR